MSWLREYSQKVGYTGDVNLERLIPVKQTYQKYAITIDQFNLTWRRDPDSIWCGCSWHYLYHPTSMPEVVYADDNAITLRMGDRQEQITIRSDDNGNYEVRHAFYRTGDNIAVNEFTFHQAPGKPFWECQLNETEQLQVAAFLKRWMWDP